MVLLYLGLCIFNYLSIGRHHHRLLRLRFMELGVLFHHGE